MLSGYGKSSDSGISGSWSFDELAVPWFKWRHKCGMHGYQKCGSGEGGVRSGGYDLCIDCDSF